MTLFVPIALGILITAVMAIWSKKLTYAALWLAASLVGVAILFLTLTAEFLAIVQVLVYAGAVITLILFAIMFTRGGIEES